MKQIKNQVVPRKGNYTHSDHFGTSRTYSSTWEFSRRFVTFGTGPRVKPVGFKPMTDYQLISEEFTGIPNVLTRTFTVNGNSGFERLSGVIPASYLRDISEYRENPGLANARALVSTRARANLKNGDLNLSVALAEMPLMANLLGSNIRTLGDFVKAVSERKFKKARRVLGIKKSATDSRKSSHDFMLEVQYGWYPLVLDIKAAYEHLCKGYIVKGYTVTAKSRIRLVDRYHENFNRTHGALTDVSTRHNRQITTDVGTVIVADVKNPLLYNAASYGFTNPLSLLWERKPWSFLTDWVVPLSEMITALDATYGLSFRTGCDTTFVRVENFATPGNPIKGRYNVEYQSPAESAGRFSGVRYSRKELKSFPSIHPYYNPDPLSSPWRILAALNLIGQRLP